MVFYSAGLLCWCLSFSCVNSEGLLSCGIGHADSFPWCIVVRFIWVRLSRLCPVRYSLLACRELPSFLFVFKYLCLALVVADEVSGDISAFV